MEVIMKNGSLQPGLTYEFSFKVTEKITVPYLYPESPEFSLMPAVLATGYMVGLFEWTCIQAVNPYIDWPREQTVGTRINLSHEAATPVGLSVTVKVRLEAIEGRRLVFSIKAHDGIDKISEGTHERYIILASKFNEKAQTKAARGMSS
jgi:fluoroacetyl-CoA thioesterase